MSAEQQEKGKREKDHYSVGDAGFWGIANLTVRGTYLLMRLGTIWGKTAKQKKKAVRAFEQSLVKSGLPAEAIAQLTKVYHDVFDLSALLDWKTYHTRGQRKEKKR
ncbi:hypothetical protein [Brevibacillus migulae]|uniref:hypothetical protein n=1 Tax=Brevibacillus migulae TaxID=1644114 RepID=UPI00106E44A5|nr:hypothetical protein [Brevibacillus migulae]